MNLMEKTHQRLKNNQANVIDSLDDLQDNLATALTDQHSLKLSISKAKLLESMKSPWVQPQQHMVATQKEVAFYNLYALAEAEQESLYAVLRLRKQELNEVKTAYGHLVNSMGALIESQKLLLTHLNQPANAQINAFIGNALAEAKAFSKSLDESENPRLKSLAAKVAKAETQVDKALGRFNKALEKLLK